MLWECLFFVGFIWFGDWFFIPITDAEVAKCSDPCLPRVYHPKKAVGSTTVEQLEKAGQSGTA